jgi:single-strand DNA-binding protein
MMKNRIEVEGYLAAKPEQRFLPSGASVANARLGETYTIKRNGSTEEKYTNWHSLSFYGDLATAASRLEKGAHLFVVGWIENREWTAKDGAKRSVWELNVSSFHKIAPASPKTGVGEGESNAA